MKIHLYPLFTVCSCAVFFFWLLSPSLMAQEDMPAVKTETIYHSRSINDYPFHKSLQGELAPFYHGVASGDPLQDRVILWTRITPEVEGEISGTWRICTDTSLLNVVNEGSFTTNADKDYTVKIDATGLQPGTVYYYGFRALGAYSLTGRTMTLPENSDHLRMAVVSCSNYQSGYFNAYNRIAARNDLDLVIHLGDYIYEYNSAGFGGDPDLPERYHFPDLEILNLADYRTRHSFYKLDPDLMRLHQQLPFICVWDDHESANNAYKDGAENHDPATEGDWYDRKADSKTAYFEWMPIREQDNGVIYRRFSFGNLADLIMLDTRLEGRQKQVTGADDTSYHSPQRTILGEEQAAWLFNNLQNETAQWKLLGNQVVFAPVNLGALSTVPLAFGAIADMWEGYPVERDSVIRFIQDEQLDNVVVLTGDVHVSFAFDITPTPSDTASYDPATGMGSIAVEMVAPSITSDSWGDYLGAGTTDLFDTVLGASNPHIKYKELYSHGYFILDVTTEKTQGDWFYVDAIKTPSPLEHHAYSLYTLNGENFLREASEISAPKEDKVPAPLTPAFYTGLPKPAPDAAIFSLYPMPVTDVCTLSYGINKTGHVKIAVYDISGKEIAAIFNESQNAGLYQMRLDLSDIPSGTYVLRIIAGHQLLARQIEIIK